LTQIPGAARVQNATVIDAGFKTFVKIGWDNGNISTFPAPWLRVFAPLVAKQLSWSSKQPATDQGWLTRTLEILEIWYEDIFPDLSPVMKSRIYDLLLREDTAVIINVVGLPDPVAEDERACKNAIVTKILKKLFGEVFKHPRRQPDTTFNISSHRKEDVKKGAELPNYNTSKLLLPHTDLSFYESPSQVQ
jgi:hypothetical protein